MFVYPQRPEALLLGTESGWSAYWKLFDTFIDIGHINLAELMLVNSMEAFGERPIVLKRLALVNMVKGNTGAAQVYLGALEGTLFDAGWARSYLEKIERDPNLSTDAEVQHLRSVMPKTDRYRDIRGINENMYLDLLDRNRHNRMAFEYLMAIYLFTGQLDKLAGNMDRLSDFDYTGIPRVYEEAMLFYGYTTRKEIEPKGRKISEESRARFDGFCNTFLVRYGGNKQLALDELAKNYGDSYLFYCFYRYSGMKK
jgi:hypothetical protein